MDCENRAAKGKEDMDCENRAAGGVHFVLVHGAMHGAWCWYKIVKLLEEDGHKVSAIDLKSAGTNPATADSIMSFDEYNQPFMDFLAHLPQKEKIVLVGHSMGGVSLACASELFPHLIAVAVYVCAPMVRGGEFMEREKEIMSLDKDIADQIEFRFANGLGEFPTSVLVPKKVQKDCYYNTTSMLDATLASLLIRPFPTMIMANLSLETTEERYGVVPRIYVKTAQDNVLSLAKQEEVIAHSPPEKIYMIDSDHSPFFSSPEKLHSLLLEIAETYCVKL